MFHQLHRLATWLRHKREHDGGIEDPAVTSLEMKLQALRLLQEHFNELCLSDSRRLELIHEYEATLRNNIEYNDLLRLPQRLRECHREFRYYEPAIHPIRENLKNLIVGLESDLEEKLKETRT